MKNDIPEWLTAKQIATMCLPGLPSSTRSIHRLAKKEQWLIRKITGLGGQRYEFSITSLSPLAQSALIKKIGSPPKPSAATNTQGRHHLEEEDLFRRDETASQKQRDRANANLNALIEYRELISKGLSKADATLKVAASRGVSRGTIKRWLALVKGYPQSLWFFILIPQHIGGTALVEIDLAVWDFTLALYLNKQRLQFAHVYEKVKIFCKEYGHKKPGYKTLKRRIKSDIPPEAITLAREGAEALDTMYPPQTRDRSCFRALEAINGDGLKSRINVKWEDGTVCRPLIWFWQDLYSGKMLAWHVGKTENADVIRLATLSLIEKWGIPLNVYSDNTMASANISLTAGAKKRFRFVTTDKRLIGSFQQCGIAVHFTLPRTGRAKPIERYNKDLRERLDKNPKFFGRGTREKPVSLEEFKTILAETISQLNEKSGRKSRVCNGKSYDEIFLESYEKSTIKKATQAQLRLWFLSSKPVHVNKLNGHVRLYGSPRGENRYWHPALVQYTGQKIVLRFNPENLHAAVFAYTLSGKFIAECQCHSPAGFADTVAAREHAKNKKRYKKATRKALDAERRMTALEAIKLLPDVPDPETEMKPGAKIIKPVFGSPTRQPANESEPEPEFDLDEALAKGLEIYKQKKERERLF